MQAWAVDEVGRGTEIIASPKCSDGRDIMGYHGERSAEETGRLVRDHVSNSEALTCICPINEEHKLC